jgi:DNA repair ATPase RecN
MSTPLGKKTFADYQKAIKKNKIELKRLAKAQKIELGLNQDLESAAEDIYILLRDGNDSYQAALEDLREAENALSRLEDLKGDLQGYLNDLDAAQDKVNGLTIEAENVANDLGIRVEDLPNYDLAEDAAREADDVIGNWEETVQDIDRYI